MKKILCLICCVTLILSNSFSQLKYSLTLESALSDLSRCQIYDLNYNVKKHLTKLLIKAKDTINYYYDQQIIILYNERKHKGLKANTFYILNHGFKKKVTIDLLYAEVENTGKRIKNIQNVEQLSTILNWHNMNDTIYGRSYSLASLYPINFDKFKIRSCLLRINYTEKVIYKWLFRNDELKINTTSFY